MKRLKSKESTKPWGTVIILLQHQAEQLSQVSKAHQTLTPVFLKQSLVSCLQSGDSKDPTDFGLPSVPEATLHLKS